jgi:hypothetical protein
MIGQIIVMHPSNIRLIQRSSSGGPLSAKGESSFKPVLQHLPSLGWKGRGPVLAKCLKASSLADREQVMADELHP